MEGMIQIGRLMSSKDGATGTKVEEFESGNLINDPATRNYMFQSKIKTGYIRIESIEIAGNGKTAAIAELDFLLGD